MATISLSKEDQDFLAECEKELKDRFTENDEEFMKVFNAEPSKPPIVENWRPNSGRGNERHNRRFHPYSRYGNRDRSNQERRGFYNQEGSPRGYDDRGHHDRRGYYDQDSPHSGYDDNRQRRRYY